MIRPARATDIIRCLDMGKRFVEINGVADMLPWDEESAFALLARLIQGETGCLIVAENEDGLLVGMVGATLGLCHWNENKVICTELFWKVEPGARNGLGRDLLVALEMWAQKKECHAIGVMALSGHRPELVAEIYSRRGYRPVERVFLKGLNG